jgi:hypothetical protein
LEGAKVKPTVAAIHEAGHVVVALAKGFEIKEVYVSEDSGHTAIVAPPLPSLNGQDVIKRLGQPIPGRLETLWITKCEGLFVGEVGDLADVYLAGWAAEETFSSVDQPGMLSGGYHIGCASRAEKDIKAICDILGLQEYRHVMTTYVMRRTPYYPLWKLIHRRLQDRDFGHVARDSELDSLAALIVARKEEVKYWYFGTRDHALRRLSGVRLKALAKTLTKKKRLSGSEAERCLTDSGMSLEYRWKGLLGDLLHFVRSNYPKVITRIPRIWLP